MRKQLVFSAIAVVALATVAIPMTANAKGSHVRRVRMEDSCDPASFNAAIGPGTCAPHDGDNVTFGEFLGQLNPNDFGHEDWQFDPEKIDLKVGDSISASVRGGEFHTFTEVAAFGAGCLGFINGLLGLTGPPTIDCSHIADTGTAPGAPPVVVSGLSPGKHLFMCEIHPWMRAVVSVGNHD